MLKLANLNYKLKVKVTMADDCECVRYFTSLVKYIVSILDVVQSYSAFMQELSTETFLL